MESCIFFCKKVHVEGIGTRCKTSILYHVTASNQLSHSRELLPLIIHEHVFPIVLCEKILRLMQTMIRNSKRDEFLIVKIKILGKEEENQN